MTRWPSIIYGHVESALGTLEDFRLKKIHPSNLQKATSYQDRGIGIEIPNSANAPMSRDRASHLTTHTVVVVLSNAVKMLDQQDSYLRALDDEALVRDTLLSYTPAEADVRFAWVNTNRVLTPSGDYIVSTITFTALTCADRSL